MLKKIPAPNCVICEQPLEVTGGRRVYWSSINSILLENQPEKLPPTWRVVQLTVKHHKEYLALFGSIWNEQTINQAIGAVQQGYIPWFCQRCGKVGLCLHCGNLLTSPPGTEILKDDGSTAHVPVFAGLAPCPVCGQRDRRFSFTAIQTAFIFH